MLQWLRTLLSGFKPPQPAGPPKQVRDAVGGVIAFGKEAARLASPVAAFIFLASIARWSNENRSVKRDPSSN